MKSVRGAFRYSHTLSLSNLANLVQAASAGSRGCHTVNVNAEEGSPVPLESVATATNVWRLPIARLGVVKVHLPVEATTAVPSRWFPSKIEIVAPFVPVPETVRVVPVPVSVRLETVGAVLPSTRLNVLDRATFPATSVTMALRL